MDSPNIKIENKDTPIIQPVDGNHEGHLPTNHTSTNHESYISTDNTSNNYESHISPQQDLVVNGIAHALNLERYLYENYQKLLKHMIEEKPSLQAIKIILLNRKIIPKPSKDIYTTAKVTCSGFNYNLEDGAKLLERLTANCKGLSDNFQIIADIIKSKKSDEEILKEITNALI